MKDFEKIASQRNHSVLSTNNYKNIHSKIRVFCYSCESSFETTAHSYKNAKQTGCPECKKHITSITHKNKVTTSETKKLISLKASQRVGNLLGVTGKNHPAWKGGYGRSLNIPSTQEYFWKKKVLKAYNYKCALTGSTSNLVCHHLNGWNAYPKQRFDVLNGVVLAKEIHSKFHTVYKFGNNTETQFIEFCSLQYNVDWLTLKNNMVIISQAP